MTTRACTLPPETASVAAARRFTQGVLATWSVGEPAWTCLQLVSELATNAVIHARTEFTVELSRSDDRLRICVADGSPVSPGVRRYAESSTTGRGMRLVESMAAEWGVQRSSFGKVIWFEVDLSRTGTAFSWDDDEEVDLDAVLQSLGGDLAGPALDSGSADVRGAQYSAPVVRRHAPPPADEHGAARRAA